MTGSTAPLDPRGHTRITDRAMTRLVAAVSAEALGVRPGQVSVDMAEAGGRLDLTVRVPSRALPVEHGHTDAPDDTVPDPTERAQHDIRGTVTALTGAEIAGVTVRLTDSRIRLPGRSD